MTGELRLRAVVDDDLDEIGRFLHVHFPPDTAPEEWGGAWRQAVESTRAIAPNHGFLLERGREIVGVYMALYSARTVDGRDERFCNLAVWCVAPEYRHHSTRLARAILSQPGWHFTDFSPSTRVQEFNLRMGFQYLDTRMSLLPHVPAPTMPGRVRVSDDPGVIDALLTGEPLRLYRDHIRARYAHHLALAVRGSAVYVQWRPARLKGVNRFASIQYVSDPALFARAFPAYARWMLLHRGMIGTIAEERVVGKPRWPRMQIHSFKRMYRSATLGPEAVDYLYSELTMVP